MAFENQPPNLFLSRTNSLIAAVVTSVNLQLTKTGKELSVNITSISLTLAQTYRRICPNPPLHQA